MDQDSTLPYQTTCMLLSLADLLPTANLVATPFSRLDDAYRDYAEYTFIPSIKRIRT